MKPGTKRNEGRTDNESTPNSLAGLTAFQRDLLWTIQHRGGAEYGLGIKSTLEKYYGEEIFHGRLYPNLDDLKRNGLVEKRALDKRTNQYSLTALGKQLLADRQTWQTEGDR